ncbi:hypothetical protein ACN27F_07330 [Solwaraspora sp. WMMB335]|uniref:hypothetical protein n=1 Tax=Solwaraspora sp. WMMB335 TaxID=3404118 RepID=UPI003B939FDF
MATGASGGPPAGAEQVVDPATGQPVAHTAGGWPSGGRLDWIELAPAGADWLAMRRTLDTRDVWVARLGPNQDPPRMLLRLTGVTDACQSDGTTLVCRRTDGALSVWRLPG